MTWLVLWQKRRWHMAVQYDFDVRVDRRNTNCGRWDTMDKKYGTNDMIHLGVADMDFRGSGSHPRQFARYPGHGGVGIYRFERQVFYQYPALV